MSGDDIQREKAELNIKLMKKIRILLIVLTSFVGFTISSLCNAQTSGKASYYSNRLHGRKMSNGERYNSKGFTCAHRTLPFGTKLKVTNTRNGRSVVVRVTDRGPFVRGRIVDLSYAAAKEIGMISSGVAYIKVERLPKETEIPYAAEPKSIQMPDIEYGLAGVCYEFIPEWKEDNSTEQPKKIARKSIQKKPKTNTQKNTESPNSNTGKHQPQKETESKSWTNFFKKVKEGVTNIFE